MAPDIRDRRVAAKWGLDKADPDTVDATHSAGSPADLRARSGTDSCWKTAAERYACIAAERRGGPDFAGAAAGSGAVQAADGGTAGGFRCAEPGAAPERFFAAAVARAPIQRAGKGR